LITYKRNFDLLQIDDLVRIYQAVGWNNHDALKVKTIFENSTHVVLAYQNDDLVGFARALSDGCFNAAVYDVVVHPDYQGNGIAYEILNIMLEDFKSLSCIHLISTTGNEGFYKKLGFRKLKTGMAIYHRLKLEAEYTD